MSDAIPIPGFLDSLQPTVQAARAANANAGTNSAAAVTSSSTSSMSSYEEGSSSGAEEQLLAAAAATLPLAEQQALLLAGAAPALEQLSSVVNEVSLLAPCWTFACTFLRPSLLCLAVGLGWMGKSGRVGRGKGV